jgi:hypothetical protein
MKGTKKKQRKGGQVRFALGIGNRNANLRWEEERGQVRFSLRRGNGDANIVNCAHYVIMATSRAEMTSGIRARKGPGSGAVAAPVFQLFCM